MEELHEKKELHEIYAKKIILLTVFFSLIIMAAGAAYYRSSLFFPFALGVALTTMLNILKIIMLKREVERIADTEGKNAGSIARVQYFIRFLLTGLVLVLAAVTPFIDLWGAVAGIFTLQIAAYSMKFFL